MQLSFDHAGAGGPTLARVKMQMKDTAGNPIGRANTNLMLDTNLYKVEYSNGHTAALSANAIAENLHTQVDRWSSLTQIAIGNYRSTPFLETTNATAVQAEDALLLPLVGCEARPHFHWMGHPD